MRTQISLLETTEKELTDKIKQKMEAAKLIDVRAKFSKAMLINKPRRSLKPEVFLEAVEWDLEKLYQIVSVRVEGNKKKEVKGASDFLSRDQIEAICQSKPHTALIIQALVPNPTHRGVRYSSTI